MSPWLENSVVTLCPGNEICQSVFVTGQYEPNEFTLLSQILRPGMTFVDAGANMGLFTLFAARKVGPSGRVIAIEPSQREMQLLVSNIRANELTNVTTILAALSDHHAEQNLLLAPLDKSGHNTLGAFAYDTRLESRQPVLLRRLDDLLKAEKISNVDVIKLDIEGSEYMALCGAVDTLKKCHPTVLVELFDQALENQGSSVTQTVALLEQNGYRIHGFDPDTGSLGRFRPSSGSQNVAAFYGDSPGQ